MNNNKLSVLVVGATGKLGTRLTKYFLENSNIDVNILVRNPDKNIELCAKVKHAGGQVFKADVKEPETLKDVTKGIHTVVSALDGEDTLPGQFALLEDGVKNGIKRFVPSDYTFNYKNYKIGESFVYDVPLKFREKLETTNVKGLHVFPGLITEIFMEWIYKPGLHPYMNTKQKLEITSFDDVAKYVVAAVSREDRVGDLMIAGDIMTPVEMAEIFEKATGKKFVDSFKTFEELQKRKEEEKEKGQQFYVDLLGFSEATYDSRISLPYIQNEEFPEVKPVEFEEWLKLNFVEK